MRKEIIHLQDVESFAFVKHQIFSGMSGSGKTMSAELMLENQVLFGKRKCYSFDVSDRFENTTYGVEENNPALIQSYSRHPAMINDYQLKPMAFKSKVYMICGRGLLYNNRYPANLEVVSLNPKDLTIRHLNILLGNTPALLPILNSFQADYGDDVNLQDMYDILFKSEMRGKKVKMFKCQPQSLNMIKVRIRSLIQTGIFSDKLPRLDFNEIIKNQDEIICFSSFLLEHEFEIEMAYGIIMAKFWQEEQHPIIHFPFFSFLN